jgi:hypothetical protein
MESPSGTNAAISMSEEVIFGTRNLDLGSVAGVPGLENLIVAKLLRKFAVFCETGRLVTAFNRARHWAKESSPHLDTLFKI